MFICIIVLLVFVFLTIICQLHENGMMWFCYLQLYRFLVFWKGTRKEQKQGMEIHPGRSRPKHLTSAKPDAGRRDWQKLTERNEEA